MKEMIAMGTILKQKTDILLIDNYDSFTYNLVQYLGMLGERIMVCRNDKVNLKEIKRIHPKRIVISPGPGRPHDAGASIQIIKEMCKEIPVLGVCLGHQCMGATFGADIISSGEIVHGKTSEIYHDGKTIFRSICNPLIAARYHSLIIKENTLPDDFEISAKTQDGIIMGIRHKRFALEGVQFHPESFLTKDGLSILKNFIQ